MNTDRKDAGSSLGGDRDVTAERRTLWYVLVLNVGPVVAFGIAGVLEDLSAAIANGLDNTSDGLVYGISLLALNRVPKWKDMAVGVSGVLLLLFAAGMLFDVDRRYFQGSEPIGPTMMAMAFVAAIINFISNGGILVGGALVLWTGANWPDPVVGFATALIAIKGSIEILRDARETARKEREAAA